jgi:hypothetical protein
MNEFQTYRSVDIVGTVDFSRDAKNPKPAHQTIPKAAGTRLLASKKRLR